MLVDPTTNGASRAQVVLEGPMAAAASGASSFRGGVGTGSAKVTALHRAIERRSRLAVEVVDAWKRISVDPKLDHAYLGAHSPEALVGVGLALRAPNDKA